MTQPAIPEPVPQERVDQSRLRAADADRDAVVERLRKAHADGRLTLVEFDERAAAAYAARTYAELVPLTADLPAAAPPLPFAQPDPTPHQAARPARRRHAGHLVWRIVGSAWFFASFVNLLIWGIVSIATASWIYPWWIWVAGPWGAVLLAGWVSGFGRPRDR